MLIKLGITSASFSVSIIGFGFIVVPFIASVCFATVFTTEIATQFLKHKEQEYMKSYLMIGDTLKRFQEIHTKSLGDIQIDEEESQFFVNSYNNYNNQETQPQEKNFYHQYKH